MPLDAVYRVVLAQNDFERRNVRQLPDSYPPVIAAMLDSGTMGTVFIQQLGVTIRPGALRGANLP